MKICKVKVISILMMVGLPLATMGQPADVVFVSGYEPGVSIGFVGDQSVLMTAAGQSHTFAVEVFGPGGEPVDQAVKWHLSAGAGLTLSNIQDRSVTVNAASFATGSAQLWAIHKGSGTRAAASILQGTLKSGVHYIDSDWVLEGNSADTQIRLTRNAQTEDLAAGQVVISSDQAGILVQIATVSLEPDGVRLAVEPARLTDAFAELSVDVVSAPTRLSVALSDAPAPKLLSGGLVQKNLSEDLECTTEDNSAIGFELSEPSIDMNFDVSTMVAIEISGGEMQQFSLAAVADTGLQANSGELTFSSILSGKVVCSFQLPEIFSPPLPVSAFSFQLNVAPVVGIEALADFSGPSFSITGPKLQVSGHAEAGIIYQQAAGWAPLAEINYGGELQPLSGQFDTNIEFKLRGGPFVTAQMGLVANLGTPPFGVQLADLRFVEVKAVGEVELELESPFNVYSKDYGGPEWDLDALISGKYMAELADGALFLALDTLGLPTSIDALTGPIFDPINIPIADSPTVSIELDCVPPCTIDPALAESTLMTITSNDQQTGLATFAAAIDGAAILDDLGTATYANGVAEFTFSPGPDDTGTYQVYPRLVTDVLSQFFPYAGTTPQTLTVGVADLFYFTFDGGLENWSDNTSGKALDEVEWLSSGGNPDGNVKLNGSDFARIENPPEPNAWIFKTLALPAEAGTLKLDVRADPNPDGDNDAALRVRLSTGGTFHTLIDWQVLSGGHWRTRSADISDYAGQTVTIYIEQDDDAEGVGEFIFIDNVRIGAIPPHFD